MSANWSNPTLASNYTDVLTELKARDESLAKLDFSSDTNIVVGAIRWNSGATQWQAWSGTAWSDIFPALTTHLNSTSNPHSVTAAQVGAPTTAQLSAHTSDTSNPHSVTTTQISALKTTNNLSDLTNVTTARTNLGAASQIDLTSTSNTLSSHISNTSNPHSVTTTQIGALKASNNLSDVVNTTSARGNIAAAKSGANSDITQTTVLTDIVSSANLYLEAANELALRSSSSSSDIVMQPRGGDANYMWRFTSDGQLLAAPNLRYNYTNTSGWSTYKRDIPTSGSITMTDVWLILNTIVHDLIAAGLWQ